MTVRRLVHLTVGLLFVALVAATPPSNAGGHDPTACRPDDPRVSIPSGLFLDACYDGMYLVLINRTSLPVIVNTSGDLMPGLRAPYAPGARIASAIAKTWSPNLLPPDFQMSVVVGSRGGSARLDYSDAIGRQYVFTQRLAALAPSIAGEPDVISQLMTETDAAFVQLVSCERAHPNFLQYSWCGATFAGDVTFAVGRFGLNSVLTISTIKQWVTLLKTLADAGLDLQDLKSGLSSYHASTQAIDVPPAAATSTTPKQQSPKTIPTSPGAPPATQPRIVIGGACTSSGGTLTGSSSGFTPGGSASIRAWRPDGSAYSGITGTSHVRSDGTIRWSWPCAGDSPGTYSTEVIDTSSGRSTGRVSFTIGVPPASATSTNPPAAQPASPAPSGRTETVGSNAHTWTNYANAGGSAGPVIPQGSTVSVACRLTGFRVADGNTWWYRIASAPWNNAYYVSADAFYNNGQTAGSLHGTPWVDEAVPMC